MNELWNTYEGATEEVKKGAYRYVRISDEKGDSKCQIAEFEVSGIITNTNANDDVDCDAEI